MKTKLYSVLTALTMLMPTFAATARADETQQQESSSGYYSIEEDFTEYDESNSVAQWAIGEPDENGNGKVVATRSDGAKWTCCIKWPTWGQAKQSSTVKIDTANDVMQYKGWGGWEASVFFDTADEFELGDVHKISFTTSWGQRFWGMDFFMNETKKTCLRFGQMGNEGSGMSGTMNVPYVQIKSNDSNLQTFYDEKNTAGFNINDKEATWDIEISGTYLKWTVTSGQGRVWSGSTNLDEEYAEDLFGNYEHLAGVFSGCDHFATLKHFKYETGSYYTPEMGEPSEVIYKDVFAEAEDVTDEYGLADDDTHKIYKFKEAVPIRRLVSMDKFSEVGLSTDGVTFDNYDCTAKQLVNTKSSAEYQYVKLPNAPAKSFMLFKQINNGDTITARKGEATAIYVYRNGTAQQGLPFEISDSNYATIDGRGGIKLKKEGEVTVSLEGEADDYEITIKIEGPLSDALEAEGDTAPIIAYVATQQEILNNLNTAIANNDKTAVQNFFGTVSDNSVTLNDMDLIDAQPFMDLKFDAPLKFGAFADRILTYKDGFKCSGTMESIEAVEETFIKELKVGNIEGLATAEAVAQALDTNNDILKLDLSDKYYKARESAIAGEFVNATFENYGDLEERLADVTVIINYKNTISADFVNGLLKDFKTAIGYNEAHYNAITDKATFANALIARKNNITDVDGIKSFMDSYTPTPVATQKPVTIGGGGGSTGSHKTEYVDTSVTGKDNEKTEKDPAVDNAQLFTDLPTDHWCYEAVRYLKAKNSISGYDDGSFKPNNSVTRAEFIKMLVGMFASDTELTEDFVSQFEDLNGDEWYYESLAKAEQIGILQGADGKCNPGGNITRQEIAVITYRMIEQLGKTINRDSTIEKFADENEIAEWASAIVLKMQAAGIINGTDGKFMPNGEATRTMAAQILYKAVSSFEDTAE